ncbi:two-component system, response regulator [Companilactobacillus paralimentarius DSM 13238 = JCM 10415]|jgi:Response regulators consisting of a CheY-like receiver domain and a winged-helix DNA-binding domain|uniref:Two-component system, response regulator n=1 Tax=Companilactobacillus paralimentarius DSM 13238 = JCM 10415 TaxID=1122151 RepID=A0A0R1PIV6_9LACO|nr:response regulator transcription factor [Companilactobacillus paralimentarius]KAE9563565.1 two-component system response regulator [Companilactobacillus paralimentarius]KRL32278.1 two-component system, response regulator [Companilactobacillus paralimentarius DSM 13238 = JCM 10415]MDR4934606.1 response regulator transcription factor [Companilactobacillus paralimentarius]QFR68751.1 response regulator [Companilactobacillus paralimentarius]
MAKIMIIEDDQSISKLISENLAKWQINSYITKDFNNIIDQFNEYKPDLVLLDINLPVYDGYYWNQEIRKISKIPIIIISSRNSNMDQIMAMNMGADDFVEKPFSVDILVAKINALLRRTYDFTKNTSDVIEHNGLKLNLSSGSVEIDDNKIDLSKNEYKLLQRLLKDQGKIVTREQLLNFMWDDERFVDDNTLTVNINRLRSKIEKYGLKNYIVTKVGQGYIIP